MKVVVPVCAALFATTIAFARPSQPEEFGRVRDGKGWHWNFTFTPKALQRDPELNMTFFTEMTDEGCGRPQANLQNPIFYVLKQTGRRDVGETGGGAAPAPEELMRVTELALARASYHPARRIGQQPTLAIFLLWGVHAQPPSEAVDISPELAKANFYERALLVGGTAFARELREASQLDDDFALAGASPFSNLFSAQRRIALKNPTNEFLLQQATADVYFVVASAYDFAALSRNERVLLWRTKMTVNTSGVSLRESLGPTILAATPYFGREMPGALVVTKQISRKGYVHIDPTEMIEYVDPQSTKAGEASAGESSSQSVRKPEPPLP